MIYLYFILGLIAGSLGIYFLIKPKLKKINEINEQVEKYNKQLIEENKNLTNEHSELEKDISILQCKKEEASSSITILEQQALEAANKLYERSLEVANEKMSAAADTLSSNYKKAEQEAQLEYSTLMEEAATQFSQYMIEKTKQMTEINTKLTQLQEKMIAAIEAAKRQEEKELELEKYKINVSEIDLLEINRLREIAPYFRNSRAVYKIIWESYFRNPCSDMINRILGSETSSGIYKITNLKNEKVYIGQAIDLSQRLKDHVKAGLGIDTPSNKLYIAMLKDGVENFSFEIIEKCNRETLNEKEKYWISFYKSQEHGYNMTKGNN